MVVITVRLGKTALTVSEIGFGADHFGTAISDSDASYFLDAFVDMGGNLIDTANVYGKWVKGAGNASERFLGQWLKRTKKEVIIATKGGHYDLSTPSVMRLHKNEIERDLDESLLSLGLDTVDLYWLHRDDTAMPIGEILDTMEGFVKAGKIRYYGASNYTAKRLWEADAYAKAHGITGFSAVSNRYSALKENETVGGDPTLVTVRDGELAFHQKTLCPLIPYQASGRGYFTKLKEGRASPSLAALYGNAHNHALYETLSAFSEAEGVSLQAAMLLATATADFPVIPLTTLNRREHLKDLADAMKLLQEGKRITQYDGH